MSWWKVYATIFVMSFRGSSSLLYPRCSLHHRLFKRSLSMMAVKNPPKCLYLQSVPEGETDSHEWKYSVIKSDSSRWLNCLREDRSLFLIPIASEGLISRLRCAECPLGSLAFWFQRLTNHRSFGVSDLDLRSLPASWRDRILASRELLSP